MTLRPMFFILMLLAMFASPRAFAATEALIALHDGGEDAWSRRLALQELLLERYRFDRVEVVVDATASEIPAKVRAFLETPERRSDWRFVWVSGPGSREVESVCPAPDTPSVRPGSAALVMAPTCFLDIIEFPQGSRRFAVRAPGGMPERDHGIHGTDATGRELAVITLPSDEARFIQGTDSLLFDHLRMTGTGGFHPASLLSTLRNGFRWNGSDYAPALDLAAGSGGRGLIDSDKGEKETVGDTLFFAGRPAVVIADGAPLVDLSAGDAEPVLHLAISQRVFVLRRDRSGEYRYVRVKDRFFGWMRKDDLGF